jgi:hypothetical protein
MIFDNAKTIGIKIFDLLKEEALEVPKGTVFLAIYVALCALIEAGEHLRQLN